MSVGGEREARYVWALPDDAYDGRPIAAPGAVYAANFLFGVHLARGQRTLGASFAVEHESGKFAAALFQRMTGVVDEFRARLARKLSGDVAPSHGPPVRVFIETLLSSAEERAPERRVGAFAHLRTGVDLRARPAEAYSTSAVAPSARQHLRSLGDRQHTVGFRLVVVPMLPPDELDYADAWRDAVAAARKVHADFETNGGPERPRGGAAARSGPPPSFGAYASSVRTHLLLYDHVVVARAADCLVRRRVATADGVEARIHDPGVEWAANPAHPSRTLGARLMIEAAPHETLAVQRTYGEYVSSADGMWRFPIADAVIEVPACRQTIVALDRAALPEWQARNIERVDLGARALVARRAPPPPPRVDDDDTRSGDSARSSSSSSSSSSASKPPLPSFDEAMRAADDDEPTTMIARECAAVAARSTGAVAAPTLYARVVARLGGRAPTLDDARDLVTELRVAGAATATAAAGDDDDPDFDDNNNAAPAFASLVASRGADVDLDAAAPFNPSALAALDYASTVRAGGELDTHALERLRVATRKHELIYKARDTDGSIEAVAARHASRDQARLAYEARARRFLDEYEATCTSSTSRVSEPMRALNAWFEALARNDRSADDNATPATWLGEYARVLRTRDGTPLSMMGSAVARDLMRLEHSGFTSTCHLAQSVINEGINCAYVHDIGALRPHFMLQGPPGSGKSHVGGSLAAWLVPGTVMAINSFTPQAWSINGSMTDQIFIVDETPKNIMSTPANASDDGPESIWKQLLTDNRVSRRYQNYTDAGDRNGASSFLEAQGSWVSMHNWPKRHISAAILDRFFYFVFAKHRRPARAANALANAHKRMVASNREDHSTFVRALRSKQFLHSRTEDAIAARMLTDVTMSAFHRLLRVFEAALEEATGITIPPRTGIRLEAMARLYTISTALYAVYSLPCSRWYRRPFVAESLLDLDPLLWCTDETTYYVIQACSAAFDDSRAAIIARHMRELVAVRERAASCAAPLYYCADTSFGGDVVFSNGGARNVLGGGAPLPLGSYEAAAAAAPYDAGARAATPAHADRYYAYYALDASLRTVAGDVAARTQGTEVELSQAEVREALIDMVNRPLYVVAPPYDLVAGARGTTSVAPRAGARARRVPALFEERGRLFVHVEWVTSTVDPIDRAIAACADRFVRERPIVEGRVIDGDNPQLLRVRTLRRAARTHRFVDPQFATALEQDAAFEVDERDAERVAAARAADRAHVDARGSIALEGSVNEQARRERAAELYLDPDVDGAPGGTCDIEALDAWAAEHHARPLAAPRYPDDFTVKARARAARADPDVDDDDKDDDDDEQEAPAAKRARA